MTDILPRLDGNCAPLGWYYLTIIIGGLCVPSDSLLLGLLWLCMVALTWPAVHRSVNRADTVESESETTPGP